MGSIPDTVQNFTFLQKSFKVAYSANYAFLRYHR